MRVGLTDGSLTASKSEAPADSAAAPSLDEFPPTARRVLAPAADLAAALEATRQLAHSHYENFSVISVLLPKRLRQDFCNVYAFCRVADDLGDEVGDRGKAIELLVWFGGLTRSCYAGRVDTALFMAL